MAIPPGFERIKLTEKREFEDGNQLDQHFILAESRFHRMLAAAGPGINPHQYKIVSVELIKNPGLWQRFESKKAEFRKEGVASQPLLLFHGTRKENMDRIVQENFKLDHVANGRKYGNGVYFSERPELSALYSGGADSVLLCQVLPGRTSSGRLSPGVDSAEVKDCKDERCFAVVIPNVDQIFPTYIINFTKTSMIRHTQTAPFSQSQAQAPCWSGFAVTGGYRRRRLGEFPGNGFLQAVESWDYKHFLLSMGMKGEKAEEVLQCSGVTVSESSSRDKVFLIFSTNQGVNMSDTITFDSGFSEESFHDGILYSCRWSRSGDSDSCRLVKRCLPPLPWQKAYTVTFEFTVSQLKIFFRRGVGASHEFSCEVIYLKV